MTVAPNPIWFDDFIGNSIDARYNLSHCANGGSVKIASLTGYKPVAGASYSTNGRIVLDAPAAGAVASMRIGEQPGAGPPYSGIDLRNWDSRADVVFEVHGYIPTTPGIAGFSSSLGFTGFNDVAGGYVMTMYADTTASPYWTLQLENNGITKNIVSTAVVLTNTDFTMRLQTSSYGQTVNMYMNDVLAATWTDPTSGTKYIPAQALILESTCQGVGAAAQLVLDYWYCTMTRLPLTPQ